MAETTLYFATNRRPNDPDQPTDFSSEFVGNLSGIRFGEARVKGNDLFKLAGDDELTRLGKRAKITVEYEHLDEDESKSVLGSRAVFRKIRKEMLAGQDLLFLIHGYDYTFAQAIARAAQLQQWYAAKRPLVMFLFTWPSLGRGVSPITYDDERERARASGAALGRVMLKAADFIRTVRRNGPCKQRIHLMAHSMGNWVLRGGVQYARTFVGDNTPPLLDEVCLMAADEDHDTLSKGYKLQPILRGCSRLTVYYHGRDLALKASDYAMGNPDRLGLSGADEAESLPKKVSLVNVGPAIYWDPPSRQRDWQEDDSGHQYYRNNDIVRDDVVQLLAGAADDEIPGRERREGEWRISRPRSPRRRGGPRR